MNNCINLSIKNKDKFLYKLDLYPVDLPYNGG